MNPSCCYYKFSNVTTIYSEGKPFAIYNGANEELVYLHLDYQGSLMAITDHIGDLIENRSGVYAERSRSNTWGRPRDPNNWSYNIGMAFGGAGNGITMRGYTMHEHLEMFSLINMNGRLYDPVLGRMLSPDNYIQAPDNTQSYNRYSYCINNPLKYTDPSGEVFGFDDAIIIGVALYSAYQAGSAANGGKDVGKWDWNAKTFGSMAIGAGTALIAGYGAAGIVAGGGPLSGTLSIVAGSYTSSVGMHIATGGQSKVSIGFGAGSYNVDGNSFDGIWNWDENSGLENFGYSLGTFANFSDVWAIGKGVFKKGANVGSKELLTKNDLIGHSASGDIGNLNKSNLDINWGPTKHHAFFGSDGTNQYSFNDFNKKSVTRIKVNSLRLDKYNDAVKLINRQQARGLNYNGFFRNCSTQVSRAYNSGGVFNIPLPHPLFLEMQMLIRNNPYLINSTLNK